MFLNTNYKEILPRNVVNAGAIHTLTLMHELAFAN